MEKTHWKKVFNKDYLGACDFEDSKDIKAVINHVEIREIKDTSGASSKRNIAVFNGGIKPMVLNVTNCKVIKKFSKSPYIEDWRNIAVQIYIKDDIKAFGEITEGLRFREVQPKIGKDELIPNTQQWKAAIEFLKSGKTIDKIESKYTISEYNRVLLMEAAI